MARGRLRGLAWVGCLFFVMELVGQAGETLIDEARVAVNSLRTQNQALQQEVQQRAAEIRVLTESLAIAQTEAELFRRRWAEIQLQAQSLGANLNEASVVALQRHLIESVRQLHQVSGERHRLAEQLKALVTAVEVGGERLSEELGRSRSLLAGSEKSSFHLDSLGGTDSGSVTAAKILVVNPSLRLVVLNIGADQGARVGMPFVVMRGERVVAELRVIEVRRNVCGAVIEQLEKNVTLVTGDAVRVTKS